MIASAWQRILLPIAVIVTVMFFFACTAQNGPEQGDTTGDTVQNRPGEVSDILDAQEFRSVIAATPELVMIDFYADWCDPCKLLAPVLEEIAKENPGQARIYRVDVEENKDLVRSFGMRGIPFVIYFKDHQVIHHRTGLHPKEVYLEAIRRFS